MLLRSRFTSSLSFLICLTLLQACNTPQQGQAPNTDASDKTVIMQYSRGACYGTCPVFDVYAMDDGTLLYRGRHFAPREGRYESRLSPAELRMLNSVLELVRNTPFEADLEPAAEDMPSYKIGFLRGKKWEEHTGHGEVPFHFGDIEDMVLSWVDENRWERTSAEAFEETKQTRIPEEIMLELTGEEEIRTLQSEYTLYQFTPLRRLSPNLPYWLITFDKRAIDPDAMLEILRADPRVKHAEFNHKVEQRQGGQ